MVGSRKKLELNIPATEAWELIKDYNGMTKWRPTVAKSEIIEGVDNSIGCVRKLTFLNGPILYEKLLDYDSSKMMIVYDIHKIENGSFPVSSYKATLQIESFDSNKSVLVWKSKFKRTIRARIPVQKEMTKKRWTWLIKIFPIYKIYFHGYLSYARATRNSYIL